jgi:TonB-linked SusC/RagA family outer membrane protein
MNDSLSVDIQGKNMTIGQIFKAVHQQTGYVVFYNNGILDDQERLDMHFVHADIREVMDFLTRKTQLSYEIKDRFILLQKAEEPAPAVQPTTLAKTEAPDVVITGTVRDRLGDPLPGVSIVLKGNSSVGTVTAANGNYSLTLPNQPDSLVFSYVGYLTQEVAVNGRSKIDIILENSVAGLSQVVVVGYGTQKKSDLTGAISTVSADQLDKATTPDVSHMLQGKVAGLQIQQNSAQPGGGLDILIRGGGSINASNRPLFVVDGFPISETSQPSGTDPLAYYTEGSLGALNSLNPNDIQTITVLKDASATAIYGSRAANGVVLITTKRGATGEAKISYTGNYSVQPYDNNRWKLLSFQQWLQTYNEAGWENFLYENQVAPWGTKTLEEAQANPVAGLYTPRFSQAFIDNAKQGTDWLSLITRTGTVMQHNLSISGGSEGVKYFLSGNYFKQDGVVRNSGIERASFRSNIDVKLNKIMKLMTSLNGNRVTNFNSQLGDDQYEKSGIITAALQTGPHIRARDENGGYPINPDAAIQPNPASLLTMTDKGRQEKLLADVALDINPVEHLNINLKWGIDKSTYKRWIYTPTTIVRGRAEQGIADIANSDNSHYLLQATASYNNTFASDHRVDIMVGASRERFIDDMDAQNATSFITDAFLMYNTGAATGKKTLSSSHIESEIASLFGRVNYNYKSKYYFTFSLRNDGTSVFVKGHQWGLFPSTALAWDITKESFFNFSPEKISQLKLRVSYGEIGNSSIGTNAFAAYAAVPAYLSGTRQRVIGVLPDRLENPDLTWETTKEFNIGLDFSVLNDKVSGSFEYFNKQVSDLLDTKQLQSYQPINTVIANIGATRVKGLEFTISTLNISGPEFSWRSTLNVSRYKTTWDRRAPDWKPAIYEKDHDPVNGMFYRHAEGILQVGQHAPEAQPDLLPGQIIISDINGFVRDDNGDPVVDEKGRFVLSGSPDGIIDDADYVLIGDRSPSVSAGLVNSIEYKNFSLNFSFNGVFGRKMEDPNFMRYGLDASGVFSSGQNRFVNVLNRWTPTNPSTTQPSSYQGSSIYGDGDFFLQKAWFIRMQDLSLGYRLPDQWLKGIFSRVEVQVGAHNLFLITPYKGMDPETDVYAAAYPNMRIYTFGLTLDF